MVRKELSKTEKSIGNPSQEPWRFRHALTLSAAIFSVIFVFLLSLSIFLLLGAIQSFTTLPHGKAAMGLAAGTCSIMLSCALVSVIAANSIASLFLRCKLKRAVPFPLVMNWFEISGPDAMTGLIRQHGLKVYISKRQTRKETENLPCRLLPLYALPVYAPGARWLLRAFNEIYFDAEQVDRLFARNLEAMRRARPEMLLTEASLARETAAKLQITENKEKSNRGFEGRLGNMKKQNDFYKLHGYVITRLTQVFLDKWEKRKTKTEKIITHANIQKLAADIMEEQPFLKNKLLEKGAKRNPFLPRHMEDLFRHAMPDEMVDWRNGKPTLESLIDKCVKETGEVFDEMDSEEGDSKPTRDMP